MESPLTGRTLRALSLCYFVVPVCGAWGALTHGLKRTGTALAFNCVPNLDYILFICKILSIFKKKIFYFAHGPVKSDLCLLIDGEPEGELPVSLSQNL